MAKIVEAMTMLETAELARTKAARRSIWNFRSPNIVVLSVLAVGLATNEWRSSCSKFLLDQLFLRCKDHPLHLMRGNFAPN